MSDHALSDGTMGPDTSLMGQVSTVAVPSNVPLVLGSLAILPVVIPIGPVLPVLLLVPLGFAVSMPALPNGMLMPELTYPSSLCHDVANSLPLHFTPALQAVLPLLSYQLLTAVTRADDAEFKLAVMTLDQDQGPDLS